MFSVIDSDLALALYYHPQDGINEETMIDTLFDDTEQGEDYSTYIYILARLTNGKYIYLWGNCSYEGWEYHSSLDSHISESITDILETLALDSYGNDTIARAHTALREHLK